MIKIVKKLTSGVIEQSFESREDLTKLRPLKSQTLYLKSRAGRDDSGQVSIRHRGAGAKRLYRKITTLDEFLDIEAEVKRLEYDPNRSANLALIELKNGQKRYIIASENLKVGNAVQAGLKTPKRTGDRAPLKEFFVGSNVYDVQIRPQSGSIMVRSAGTTASVMAHDGEYTLLKLPSGELRRIHSQSFASLGQVSNPDHANIRLGKAGRVRKMGIRPTVRGKVMSPRAHPHGGGEGVNPIGLKYPKTPWGKVAIGAKTRKAKNSDKFIVKRRVKRR